MAPPRWLGGPTKGEMAEWSKARAWKVRNRQKRFVGSNPTFSANKQHKL